MSHYNFSNGSAGNGITRKTSFVASAVLGFALLLSACSPAPSPSASAPPVSPEPSAEASSPVVSSHLAFERTEDGGFTADIVIHPDGQLEARQIGVGYANWEYVVGPRVTIRMTDDEGRMVFTPLLACADPDRQAEMPDDRPKSLVDMPAGPYKAELRITRDGEATGAELRLTGTEGQRNASVSWNLEACTDDRDGTQIDPAVEAQLLAMLPETLEVAGETFTFERTVSRAAGESFPGIALDDLTDVTVVHAVASGGFGDTLIMAYVINDGSQLANSDLLVARQQTLADFGCTEKAVEEISFYECGVSSWAGFTVDDRGTLFEVFSNNYPETVTGIMEIAGHRTSPPAP